MIMKTYKFFQNTLLSKQKRKKHPRKSLIFSKVLPCKPTSLRKLTFHSTTKTKSSSSFLDFQYTKIFLKTFWQPCKFLKVGLSSPKKISIISFIQKPLKDDEKCFSCNAFLSFYHDFLVMQRKRLDQNYKFHDVTTWLTNNYNTHSVQYLTK